MLWNWQHPDWPNFRFRQTLLADREALFLRQSGIVIGTVRHVPDDERLSLVIELISTEALKTSEIEGEILDRDSVQSSLRRQFGLQDDGRRGAPAEQGISEMLADLYRRWNETLDEAMLFQWHQWLMQGGTELRTIGGYRRHEEPMQVVSGRLDRPKVHFEAPPSSAVAAEMARFCRWFNDTNSAGKTPMPSLARAGLVHLYFESIHPFEDGNGRIGRALAEKALAQGAGQPSLTALSLLIHRRRKEYYAQLEAANKTLDVEPWLDWFADLVLAAQAHTLEGLEFLLANTRLWDRLRGRLNPRQEKALSRLMRAGVDGFVGGLSASKYMALTGAPPATAGRDLMHLVELGALRRTGQLKGTRYWLTHAPNVIDDGSRTAEADS
ncbi:MAG: Fic family protein [Proteobacteria bacterium]|nr:Fic family protein [Pseudomonadota bacterium]